VEQVALAAPHGRDARQLDAQCATFIDIMSRSPKARRSVHQLSEAAKVELRRAFKEGAIRNAERDRQLAAEWDHLSAEVWARLDRNEQVDQLLIDGIDSGCAGPMDAAWRRARRAALAKHVRGRTR
jgi:hypothetical protein